jgi:hypothetical protein
MGKALAKLKGSMDKALEKHTKAWTSLFRYLRVREAIIRNDGLSTLLKGRLEQTEREIQLVKDLQRFLEDQLAYYARLFPSKERPAQEPIVIQAKYMSCVSDWLEVALESIHRERWEHAGKGLMIRLHDERRYSQQDRGGFPSRYLTSEVSLVIRPPERWV